MLFIFERNSRKEKRFRGCLIDDTVIESTRILDGRKHGNQWANLKVKLADVWKSTNMNVAWKY